MKGPKLPKVSIVLMAIFLVGGSILMLIPNLPRNVFGTDIATFITGYLGYIYIIIASFFYAKTGK